MGILLVHTQYASPQYFSSVYGSIDPILAAIGRPVAAAIGFAGIIGVFQTVVFLLGAVAAVTGCGPAAPVTGFCFVG